MHKDSQKTASGLACWGIVLCPRALQDRLEKSFRASQVSGDPTSHSKRILVLI